PPPRPACRPARRPAPSLPDSVPAPGSHGERHDRLPAENGGNRMMPPVGYFGAKTRIAGRIADLLPEHRHYVEPFAGSLTVLLATDPSRMDAATDPDGDLMTFWRVPRDRPAALEAACALTPPPRAEHQAAYQPAADELERARRVWVLLTQGRARTMRATGWR